MAVYTDKSFEEAKRELEERLAAEMNAFERETGRRVSYVSLTSELDEETWGQGALIVEIGLNPAWI